MVIGESRELSQKVEVRSEYDLNLECLQDHEIFGLYLLGHVSYQALREVYKIEEEELRALINRVCSDISSTSRKGTDKESINPDSL